MKLAAVVPNYNSAGLVLRCVEALQRQRVAAGDELAIVVVDDGSTDGSAQRLADGLGGNARLVALAENGGRAAARNRGAEAADADLQLIVDSDCNAEHEHLVEAILDAARRGAQLVYGHVVAPGEGFWERLQRSVFAARRRAFDGGDGAAYTTQCVAIAAPLFRRVGGFDGAFGYGFEDRDLFLRLLDAGAVAAFAPDARVRHEDRLALASVARKMEEAGLRSARLFAARHPAAYARMPFARLDAARRPWLRAVDALLGALAARIARAESGWLEWRWLPFALRAFAARVVYGLAFLRGTVRRQREDAASSRSMR
jgi:GT2 family glycosyltransferase